VVKLLGREVDHSTPCSAEVKNAWSFTYTPPYPFTPWCLFTHRDHFTLFTFRAILFPGFHKFGVTLCRNTSEGILIEKVKIIPSETSVS